MSTSTENQKKGLTKQKINMIIFAIILILTIVLVIQNREIVEFNVWFWKISSSKFLLLLLTFAFGALAAFLPMANKVRKKNREIRTLIKELENVRKESKPKSSKENPTK